MKKKILASTLAICLAFGSAAYLPAGTLTDSTTIKASAGDVEPTPTDLKGVWNGFQYRSGMGGIMITGYTGSKADITIPAKIEGYYVSAIDRNAFKGNTTIKSLKFENITFLYVLEGAFKDCSNLETIDFSGMSETAAKMIADDAFEGTKWLTEQRKKNPLVVIGSYSYEAKNAERISLKKVVSAYDFYCYEKFMSFSDDYFRGYTDYDDIINSFKKNVHNKFPQIKA
jgi:hypothetical protein